MDEKNLFENTQNNDSEQPSSKLNESEHPSDQTEPVALQPEVTGSDVLSSEGVGGDAGEETDETDPDEKTEQPRKKSNAALIAAMVAVFIAAFLAVFGFSSVFSAKAGFFDGVGELIERHTGKVDTDLTKAVSDINWPKYLSADASLIGPDGKEQSIELNYDGTAALINAEQNGVKAGVYLDKDIMVLTDTSTAFSLDTAPLEANISAQENSFLLGYKSVFEVSPKQRNEALEELLKILNNNLSKRCFENCSAVFDGKEYKAVRFFADENEAATILASIIEDVKASENEYLRLQTAYTLINSFSVTKGVSLDATFENAMQQVTDIYSRIEAILCFESGSPVALSAKAEIAGITIEAEYSFIRNGAKADVKTEITVKGADTEIKVTYEGEREFVSNTETDIGTVSFSITAGEIETLFSGEYTAVYNSKSLTSLNLAVSSEDLNNRFGLSLNLGEKLSFSLTNMVNGSGNTVVASAEIKNEKKKFTVTNGKLSVNEVLSDDLMEYYGLSADDLGSFNLAFNGTVDYTAKNADISASVKIGEDTAVELKANVKNSAPFFKKLLSRSFLKAKTLDITAECSLTQGEKSEKYTLGASFDISKKPDIVKMEGGESLNDDQTVINQEKFTEMQREFLPLRQKSDLVELIWQSGVLKTVNSLTAGEIDTTDINSVEFDYSDYQAIVVSESSLQQVKDLFSGEPVTEDYNGYTYLYYYSPDYKTDGSMGQNIIVVFEGDELLFKRYVNYTGVAQTDELSDVDFKKIKKGISIDEFNGLLNGRNPLLIEEAAGEEGVISTMYYGVTNEGSVMLAVEFEDGVLTRTELATEE